MPLFQTLLPLATLAMVQSRSPDERELAQATVKLEMVCEVLGKKVTRDGSGFWVDERFVATARHLLRGCGSVLVTTGDGRILLVRGVAAEDAEHDLALLDVAVPECVARPLALADIPAAAGRMMEAAFAGDVRLEPAAPVLLPAQVPTDAPATSPPTSWFRFAVRRGWIANVRDAGRFGGMLCLDVVAQRGDSGSPILSAASGEVLGVLTFIHDLGNGRSQAYAVPAPQVRALREKARSTKTIPMKEWLRRERSPEVSFIVGVGSLTGNDWSGLIAHVERYRTKLREQGDTEEKRMPLEAWLRLASAHSALAATGPTAEREGHFIAVEDAARRALAAEPANASEATQKPAGFFFLSEALLQFGRVEEAHAAAETYAKFVPEDPSSHWLLGSLAALRGDLDAARRGLASLRSALGEDHPLTKDLQRRLEERSK